MPPKPPEDARRPERSAHAPTTPAAPAVQPSVPMEEGDTVVMRVESATPAASAPPRHDPMAPRAHGHDPHAHDPHGHDPHGHYPPPGISAVSAVVSASAFRSLARPEPPIPDPIPPVPAPLPDATPVEVPVVVVPTPSVHAAPDAPMVAVPPTLGDAFQTLCAALAPHFMDDAAAYEHCLLIQGWHGPSVANQHVAWSHAMQLLGRVLDKKIEA